VLTVQDGLNPLLCISRPVPVDLLCSGAGPAFIYLPGDLADLDLVLGQVLDQVLGHGTWKVKPSLYEDLGVGCWGYLRTLKKFA